MGVPSALVSGARFGVLPPSVVAAGSTLVTSTTMISSEEDESRVIVSGSSELVELSSCVELVFSALFSDESGVP